MACAQEFIRLPIPRNPWDERVIRLSRSRYVATAATSGGRKADTAAPFQIVMRTSSSGHPSELARRRSTKGSSGSPNEHIHNYL